LRVSLLLAVVFLISDSEVHQKVDQEARNSRNGATVKCCHTTVTTAHETAVDLMHHKRLMMD